MNTRFLARFALLIVFTYVLYSNRAIGVDTLSTNVISEFNRSYKVSSPTARRDLVIKAIDEGVITRGLGISDMKGMFGDTLILFRKESATGITKAVVFFEPAKPPPKPLMSAAQSGWYLDLAFGSDNRLSHYSLSNVHK